MMYLSKETTHGLKITSMYAIVILTMHFQLYVSLFTDNSFVELVRCLFKVPGVKIFLSRTLCQDSLGNFFGCQRQRGGTHDNPTVKEFQQNTQALRIVNSFCRPVVKGNCRGNMTMKEIDKENINFTLPRRSTKGKKLKYSACSY